METFVKNTIVEFLEESPAFNAYKSYWDDNKSFGAFFDFANENLYINIALDGNTLSVETNYILDWFNVCENTPEDRIKDFIATAVSDTIYQMIR